mmetsp:Transcript_79645/g.161988  ORF Transcript_79645/g.161988 Transcript_79645/m.161988 type:complete len:257 (+) Transcript_79645:95-865(+)
MPAYAPCALLPLCLHLSQNSLRHLLGITQIHGGALLVEDGVVSTSVADTHRALHEDGLLCLPHFNDWHASNDRVRVLHRSRVDSVVRTDDEHNISVRHLGVDLVHLQHDIVRHASLSQQHIHLARHAARHRVNAKLDCDAILLQLLDKRCDRVLCVGNRHAEARHDDDALGGQQRCGHAWRVDLLVLARRLCSSGARRRRLLGRRAVATEDDISERAVHGDAHDVRQDGARRANQGADSRQQVVVEREALGSKRIA